MTITERDLARIEASLVAWHKVETHELLTDLLRGLEGIGIDVAQMYRDESALVAAVREAREALEHWPHYALHGLEVDFDKCRDPDCRRAARVLEEVKG
jgi:hypothetical protein